MKKQLIEKILEVVNKLPDYDVSGIYYDVKQKYNILGHFCYDDRTRIEFCLTNRLLKKDMIDSLKNILVHESEDSLRELFNKLSIL